MSQRKLHSHWLQMNTFLCFGNIYRTHNHTDSTRDRIYPVWLVLLHKTRVGLTAEQNNTLNFTGRLTVTKTMTISIECHILHDELDFSKQVINSAGKTKCQKAPKYDSGYKTESILVFNTR